MKGLSRALVIVVPAAFAFAPVHAHELIAAGEAKMLSAADRKAAAEAERIALDRDETIRGHEWTGPDGASGLIIVSGQFPDFYGMGRCRNLVHVIRHPKDGGVNPTYDGIVCRGWEGKWSAEPK